jgi:Ras-related GTP-binding protein A/B
MDSYLTTQRSTIFQHVGVMIYVFDVESREMGKDLEYYRDCLHGLRTYSPEAGVFLLVHKMDLVKLKDGVLEKKKKDLEEASKGVGVVVFGTSIYDETLYRVCYVSSLSPSSVPYTNISLQAWSSIVHTLIPNAAILSKHLTTFSEACSATEVILFERTTFLVIATSSSRDSEDEDNHQLDPTRYERTSELIKAFKYSCSRLREEFHSLEMELPEFTAVLDEMTKNTYVMVVVHDPTIGACIRRWSWILCSRYVRVEAAAIKMNIRLARRKFEELQGDTNLVS